MLITNIGNNLAKTGEGKTVGLISLLKIISTGTEAYACEKRVIS